MKSEALKSVKSGRVLEDTGRSLEAVCRPITGDWVELRFGVAAYTAMGGQ
jgi:hypothetical protein